MPARDTFHDVVKEALIRDGWTITDDPLQLHYGGVNVYVDPSAERLIAAEKAETLTAGETCGQHDLRGCGQRTSI